MSVIISLPNCIISCRQTRRTSPWEPACTNWSGSTLRWWTLYLAEQPQGGDTLGEEEGGGRTWLLHSDLREEGKGGQWPEAELNWTERRPGGAEREGGGNLTLNSKNLCLKMLTCSKQLNIIFNWKRVTGCFVFPPWTSPVNSERIKAEEEKFS